MESILSVENVYFSYHTKRSEIPVIKDLSLSIPPGSFTSIVGPSGCGKSTLLSLLAGLSKPEQGRINLINSTIGYMLQTDNLFEWRTVASNVCLGLEINHKKTKENVLYAYNMLEQYGLSSFLKSYPSQLSGGMRQRVALIRTLALKPDILLLDEPFSALDFQTRINVRNDIIKILKAEKKTVILVTHDISEAIAMGDVVYILTKRPTSIKEKVIIDRSMGLSEKETESIYFDKIWEVMNNDSE